MQNRRSKYLFMQHWSHMPPWWRYWWFSPACFLMPRKILDAFQHTNKSYTNGPWDEVCFPFSCLKNQVSGYTFIPNLLFSQWGAPVKVPCATSGIRLITYSSFPTYSFLYFIHNRNGQYTATGLPVKGWPYFLDHITWIVFIVVRCEVPQKTLMETQGNLRKIETYVKGKKSKGVFCQEFSGSLRLHSFSPCYPLLPHFALSALNSCPRLCSWKGPN